MINPVFLTIVPHTKSFIEPLSNLDLSMIKMKDPLALTRSLLLTISIIHRKELSSDQLYLSHQIRGNRYSMGASLMVRSRATSLFLWLWRASSLCRALSRDIGPTWLYSSPLIARGMTYSMCPSTYSHTGLLIKLPFPESLQEDMIHSN